MKIAFFLILIASLASAASKEACSYYGFTISKDGKECQFDKAVDWSKILSSRKDECAKKNGKWTQFGDMCVDAVTHG